MIELLKEYVFKLNKNFSLEINLNGYYNRFHFIKKERLFYPSIYFFKKAKEIGNKFIFEVDAHNPSSFLNIDYDYFSYFLKETNINDKDIIKIESFLNYILLVISGCLIEVSTFSL